MKKSKYFFTLILLLIIYNGCKEEEKQKLEAEEVFVEDSLNLPGYFYKKLDGKIGDDLEINMTMFREDTMLYGNYYYKKIGKPIDFSYSSRIYDSGNFIIEEFGGYTEDYEMKSTGKFEGEFINNKNAEGVWINPETGKELKLTLTESYPPGSAEFEINHLSRSFKNAAINITIPQTINFPDKEVSKKINRFIDKLLLQKSFTEDSSLYFSGFEEAMEDFIERYNEFIIEGYDTVEYGYPHFVNDFAVQINYNENYILSLENIGYIFEGGAHGLSSYLFYNFNLHNGKELTPGDLFKNDYQSVLNKIGEAKFREQFNIAKDASINEAGFWFENDEFYLNDNFSLTKGGIIFKYNSYEIAPYAAGAPEVFIPYPEIKNIIKEDGLLSFAL